MADCSVGNLVWLQQTDGGCCKERSMQLSRTFQRFPLGSNFSTQFSYSCASLLSGYSEYLGNSYLTSQLIDCPEPFWRNCVSMLSNSSNKYYAGSQKRENVEFLLLVCWKRERWHLWCWTLMHIDRASTKSHDMLTMQPCIDASSDYIAGYIRSLGWTWTFLGVMNVAMRNILTIMDEIDISDCFPIGRLGKQEVGDNSIVHLCSFPLNFKFKL